MGVTNSISEDCWGLLIQRGPWGLLIQFQGTAEVTNLKSGYLGGYLFNFRGLRRLQTKFHVVSLHIADMTLCKECYCLLTYQTRFNSNSWTNDVHA